MAKMTLKLPKLAVSMQEGKLVQWHVTTGDRVDVGQHLYTIETEKTSFDVDSPFSGVIGSLADLNESYAVGTPIAEIVT